MLSCREVTRDLTLEAELPLGRYRRLQIGLHMLICRHCRRHKAQLEQLRHVLQTVNTLEAEGIAAMPAEAKARIRNRLPS
ncbi:hypothetical protein [Chitinilyticum piscinae]|nr:hypothetical protein [Chitinilyticum piscinae]